MVIGKIIILSFSDAEDYIIDKLRSIIKDKNSVEYEYIEIMPKNILSFKDLKIHLKEQAVYRKDKLIHFSNQEFLALRFLTEHPSWVCTKEEIYNAVYTDLKVENIDNSIYCIMHNLRKKIEADPRHPEYIYTVRGVGYKFVIPEE